MIENMNVAEPLDRDNIHQAVDKAIKDTVRKSVAVHGPYWKSRLGLANLLISLNSAILVGTITFSGSLVGNATTQTKFPWILIVSWVILLLSLVLGVSCAWLHTKLYSLHPMLYNAKIELDNRIANLDQKSKNDAHDIAVIFAEISSNAHEIIEHADTQSYSTLKAALITFVLGILVFIVFGSVQMLK